MQASNEEYIDNFNRKNLTGRDHFGKVNEGKVLPVLN
jgi:hypothetical protein